MNNKLKIGLFVGVILVMLVAVTGCTTSNTSGPALTMTAKLEKTITVAGAPAVMINASITDNHAGNIRLVGTNFEMEDSTSTIHGPITNTGSGVTLENGDSAWMLRSYYIEAGSHPVTLTYFDGTNKMTCQVET
jgi:hypothetical protein